MYYFASDIHLGAGGEAFAQQTERRFVRWLDDAAQDAEAIFLVGDVFDFWFEYRGVVPKGFVRTLGKLAELTDRGIRVVFFTGNHDMWVGDYLARECGVEIYTSPQQFRLNGKNVFIAHGDNMNIDGQPVLKFLNTVFRSRTLRWLFFVAAASRPGDALRALVERQVAQIARCRGARRLAYRAADRICPPVCRRARRRPLRLRAHAFPARLPRAEPACDKPGVLGEIPSCAVLDASGGMTLKMLER